jgi:hypothetical protein
MVVAYAAENAGALSSWREDIDWNDTRHLIHSSWFELAHGYSNPKHRSARARPGSDGATLEPFEITVRT